MALLKIHDKEIEEIPVMSSKDLLEKQIEDILVESKLKSLYGQELLVIGSQIHTSTGKILDILAIDPDGQLIVVELKKGLAPREIIAQIIDYASWLNSLAEKDIEKIFKENNKDRTLTEEFKKIYKKDIGSIGDDIVLFLFAKRFPEEVKNAADFLSEKGVSIICMEFDIYGESEKDMFLYTKDIAGEESENLNDDIEKELSPTKHKDKLFFQKLAETMKEEYGEWISKFDDYELMASFKLYQKRDGSKARLYCKWRYKGSRLFLWITLQKKWLGVQIYIHNHAIFREIISQKEVDNAISSSGMKIIEDKKSKKSIEFPSSIENFRNSDGTIKDETIDTLCEQFKSAKPVLEAILKQ